MNNSTNFCGLRAEFAVPRASDGQELAYFCGNSLGLMPKSAQSEVLSVLQDWAELGVEGHFKAASPWMPYHELLREDLALVVGAKPTEVVAMNTLSVNLHLMLVSFYRPTAHRHKILIEKRAFPSDRYAVESQIRWHGFDPATSLIELAPADGAETLASEQIVAAIREHGESLALLLFPGVQYVTGQAFEIATLTQAAHAVGAIAGFDLAHAIGNLPLALHDSGPDFAVWCSYKYLNAGPGAVAGAFVHERHANTDRPRLAGWWGHNVDTRFQMGPEFVATAGADGWQLSNPPILSMAPLRASLRLFRQAGLAALRQRSELLTGMLEEKLKHQFAEQLEIITPSKVGERGAQLSVRVRAGRSAGRDCFAALEHAGVLPDWREPDIIRISPAPLYNNESDVDRLIDALSQYFSQRKG